jgi:hypothetical protein
MASQGISEELEQLVVELDNGPKAQLEAIEGMWQLRDPDAIQFLVMVYENAEDMFDDTAVRQKAGEVLGRFKGLMEQRASGEAAEEPADDTKRSGRGLRTLLTVTLLLFAAANVALFVISGNDSEGDSTVAGGDPAELRMSLLQAMETDMEQTETIARDLRSRAIDFDDGLESLDSLCERPVEDAPAPIQLSEQEQGLFPDIQQLATRPTGEYRFALAGLGASLGIWNAACESDDTVLDSGRLIDSTVTTIDAAIAARENDISTLMTTPFETPTPSVEPSPTTPPTPEPTPTPAAREREEIVQLIVQQPQRMQADAQEILNRVNAINTGARVSEQCDSAVFWNPPGVTALLRPAEVEQYPDIAEYGANENSSFNTLLDLLDELKVGWQEMCDQNSASAARLSTLEIQGERVLNRVPAAQSEVDTTFAAAAVEQ